MALDPYSGQPVYQVSSGYDAATPIRVVDPTVVGPYGGLPCIVVDPAVVGPYGGMPIYISTDPFAMPVYAISGVIS